MGTTKKEWIAVYDKNNNLTDVIRQSAIIAIGRNCTLPHMVDIVTDGGRVSLLNADVEKVVNDVLGIDLAKIPKTVR